MTYQDPNDPLRTTDPNRMPPRIIEDESSSMWGWIAGAVVVVLLAFALIGFLGRDDNVASTTTTSSPSSTVGSAPSPSTPPSTRPTSPLTQPSAPPAATPAPAPTESAPAK